MTTKSLSIQSERYSGKARTFIPMPASKKRTTSKSVFATPIASKDFSGFVISMKNTLSPEPRGLFCVVSHFYCYRFIFLPPYFLPLSCFFSGLWMFFVAIENSNTDSHKKRKNTQKSTNVGPRNTLNRLK